MPNDATDFAVARHLEGRRAQLESEKENSARLARSFVTVTTAGWGEIQKTDVQDFTCTFLRKPAIAYSYEILSRTGVPAGDPGVLVATRFPRCFGFVWNWHTDARGYFKGAYVGFAIDSLSPLLPSTLTDPGYQISHSFTFEGVAYKDVDLSLVTLP